MHHVIRINDHRTTVAKQAAMHAASGRKLSEHAAAAKMIRKDLKKAWPIVSFSVKSSSFAGGDAVDISWTDGPTTREVDQLVARYQYGSFDGMIDLYESTNTRQDIPQSKYVQTQRSMSNEAKREAVIWLNQVRGWQLRIIEHPEEARGKHTRAAWVEIDPASDVQTGYGWASHELHRVTYAQSLICRDCQHSAQVGDKFCEACGQALAHDDRYI